MPAWIESPYQSPKQNGQCIWESLYFTSKKFYVHIISAIKTLIVSRQRLEWKRNAQRHFRFSAKPVTTTGLSPFRINKCDGSLFRFIDRLKNEYVCVCSILLAQTLVTAMLKSIMVKGFANRG